MFLRERCGNSETNRNSIKRKRVYRIKNLGKEKKRHEKLQYSFHDGYVHVQLRDDVYSNSKIFMRFFAGMS